MVSPGQRLGRSGEDAAARWYEHRGFVVRHRNWRTPEGEIDLICQRAHLVVFCEVKTRSTGRFGRGVEAVDRRKRQRIRALAARWLAEHRPGGVDVRFDVADVDGRGAVLVYEGCF